MKKILLLACAVLALTACKKVDNGKLDPNAMIALNPCPSAWSASSTTKVNPEHLTALEIVERATDIWFWNDEIQPNNAIGVGFGDHQRDRVNVRLLMFGTDIISQQGHYVPDFIESRDMVLTEAYPDDSGKDTVGYIKNATLRAAKTRIQVAFAKEDYAACYAIFNEAFTFLPITGAEWLVLKSTNSN